MLLHVLGFGISISIQTPVAWKDSNNNGVVHILCGIDYVVIVNSCPKESRHLSISMHVVTSFSIVIHYKTGVAKMAHSRPFVNCDNF